MRKTSYVQFILSSWKSLHLLGTGTVNILICLQVLFIFLQRNPFLISMAWTLKLLHPWVIQSPHLDKNDKAWLNVIHAFERAKIL